MIHGTGFSFSEMFPHVYNGDGNLHRKVTVKVEGDSISKALGTGLSIQ